jgi:hypothetical protein
MTSKRALGGWIVMFALCLLLADCGGNSAVSPSPPPSNPPPDQGQWTLVWSDEFDGANGSLPDASKWNFDVGVGEGGWGNDELETYTNRPENAYLQDGMLVIKAIK